MIYAKQPKVRQDSLYESNKVDCDKRTRLTFKNTANALNFWLIISEIDSMPEINFNFIYYESRAELMGRRGIKA